MGYMLYICMSPLLVSKHFFAAAYKATLLMVLAGGEDFSAEVIGEADSAPQNRLLPACFQVNPVASGKTNSSVRCPSPFSTFPALLPTC